MKTSVLFPCFACFIPLALGACSIFDASGQSEDAINVRGKTPGGRIINIGFRPYADDTRPAFSRSVSTSNRRVLSGTVALRLCPENAAELYREKEKKTKAKHQGFEYKTYGASVSATEFAI